MIFSRESRRQVDHFSVSVSHTSRLVALLAGLLGNLKFPAICWARVESKAAIAEKLGSAISILSHFTQWPNTTPAGQANLLLFTLGVHVSITLDIADGLV